LGSALDSYWSGRPGRIDPSDDQRAPTPQPWDVQRPHTSGSRPRPTLAPAQLARRLRDFEGHDVDVERPRRMLDGSSALTSVPVGGVARPSALRPYDLTTPAAAELADRVADLLREQAIAYGIDVT
jgi:hypothetical protein